MYFKDKQETLGDVTIAMISYTLVDSENFSIFGGLYITQSNICDGAFIAKMVSLEVYLQKAPLYILAILFLFSFFKVFYIIRLSKSVISLKYFTFFNSSN